MHREINENLTTTNVSRLNRTRCGVSGGPMFRVDVVREPELTKPILCRVLSSRNERFGMKLIVRKN